VNPRVQTTSAELKRSFLQKKGLTEQEIEEALASAAARTGPQARPGTPVNLPPPQQLAFSSHYSQVRVKSIFCSYCFVLLIF
jgi:hypothetical protein